MIYKVEFISEAELDYKKLDGNLKKLVNKEIDNLSANPYLGEKLGNKYNIDLTGFYKLYFNNKKNRIVYRLIGEKVEIIEIWGIGKRDKELIYKLVGKRLNQRKKIRE